MCYSAQLKAAYVQFVRRIGFIDFRAFAELYGHRRTRPLLPRSIEDEIGRDDSDEARALWALIQARRAAQVPELEQELFAQRTRLAEAERKLALKPTKSARESARIAARKIERALAKLADLRRTELRPSDARIYPGSYAPVLIWEDGRIVVRPMRYGCRPAGKPAFYDAKYPGTYNARRDNLEGFWKGQFGRTHGVMLASAFYENVARHKSEGRALKPGEAEENTVLEFRPGDGQDMWIACLWSRWTGPDEPDLWSFAAITDEPPPEVAAAGHDRCIIPIQPANLEAWLKPDPRALAASYAVLDDRVRPTYEHRLAA
jgi:putative SOS response-associated peptidase YedK